MKNECAYYVFASVSYGGFSMKIPSKSYLISGIKIPDSSYSYDSEEKSEIIENVSKVNLFIGENNSGKSRLLRELFRTDFDIISAKLDLDLFKSSLECFSTQKEEIESSKYHKSFDKHCENLIRLNSIETISADSTEQKLVIEFINKIEQLSKNQNNITNSPYKWSDAGIALLNIFNDCFTIFVESCGMDVKDVLAYPDFKKIYIPVLRGMRPFCTHDQEYSYDDIYRSRLIKDYFEDLNLDENHEIFTGINVYSKVKEHLLGDLQKRNLIRDYETYLSVNFFDGKEVALIPSYESHEYLTIKIGDEVERPIYELGDGIQSIIIITMPLFLNKGKNVLLFIDEPELYMHPGMQRKLIETLLNQDGFENFQYFITTHSNHFLDLTLDYMDISVFSVKKELDSDNVDARNAKFIVENLSAGNRSALEYLGVQNSSVFLSNCTIWVEGITDRWYIRKYLDVYLNSDDSLSKIKEDYHYSFVEYGGNNIIHWSFLESEEMPINVERLCGRLFLIADKDDADIEKIERCMSGDCEEDDLTKKEKRYLLLQRNLGNRFLLIQNKEIENLLSKEVIQKILEDYGEDNIPDFSEVDYRDKNLGKFIDDILGTEKKRNASYCMGNSINDKNGFCKRAISNINEWDDLSVDAQDLTKKIYEFILDHN